MAKIIPLLFMRRESLRKARGWWSPTHGGTHVKRMPHKEMEAIGRGYDRVLERPQGHKFDPLIAITPEDMDAVAVSRGGWKGIGDIEVKGAGFGLVKFIWRHGEKSLKPLHLQVTREDVMAFPKVIRDYSPSRDLAENSPGREWRVERHHPVYGKRVIVYADTAMNGGRHLVSVYVQDEAREGRSAPLSLRKSNTDTRAESLGKRFEAHAEDTGAGFLHQQGQCVSAGSSLAKRGGKAKRVNCVRRI